MRKAAVITSHQIISWKGIIAMGKFWNRGGGSSDSGSSSTGSSGTGSSGTTGPSDEQIRGFMANAKTPGKDIAEAIKNGTFKADTPAKDAAERIMRGEKIE